MNRARKLWLALLYSRIRRIDRKQNLLSKAKTDALVCAAKHRNALEGPRG